MKVILSFATSAFMLMPVVGYARDDVEEDLSPLIQRADEQVYESDKALRISIGGTAGLAYNDNIYRTVRDEQDDMIAIFRPGVRLRTDMRPYHVDIEGRLEIGEHLSESENSYVDGDIKGRIGFDLSPTTNLYFGGRHQADHVAIGAFNDSPDQQAAAPTDYTYSEVMAGVKVDGPQWYTHVRAGSNFYDYENNERRDGTLLIQDDRDRNEYYGSVRLGHKFTPDTMAYMQGRYNQRDYDSRIDSTAITARDSEGYEVLLGARFGDKGDKRIPLYADLGIGYLTQEYSEAVLPDVDGVALRGELQWRPGNTWRVRGNLSREVRETSLSNVSGYLQTRLGAEVGHYFMPELLVGTKLRYTHNDFEANTGAGATDREDNIYDGGVFAQYTFMDEYTLGAEYQHVSRNSDSSERDYNSNIFLLRVGALY